MASPRTAAPPLVVAELTKRFGDQFAVRELSFEIRPGRVTGFLGRNGAGKTTTLRTAVGLAEPTSGGAFIFGQRYRELDDPRLLVGTLIDASGFHPGRRCGDELAIHAAAAGIDDSRVPVVLAEVGLDAVARKRTGALSLGMRQRLGLAVALLGEPQLLILDEPANGLDPPGMHWLRDLLRTLADRGAAVLVSSHVLAELATFADDVIVIDHGVLVRHSSIGDLLGGGAGRVVVSTPDAGRLGTIVAADGGCVSQTTDGLLVTGLEAARVGELAAGAGIPLHQLRTEVPTLEEVFLDLTGDREAIR